MRELQSLESTQFCQARNREIAANLAVQRATEIAGVLKFLLERNSLRKENLFGKVVDVGTGGGAAVFALELFGAKNVVGVDHIDKHNGFSMREVLGSQFINKPANKYLASQKAGELSLVTAFGANISLAEFYYQAKKALVSGGQILVTTDIPDSVGFLGHGVWLAENDWLRLPFLNLQIAKRDAFLAGYLSFVAANHDLKRDKFVYIEEKV